MTPGDQKMLHRLVAAVVDETATEQELAELRQLLEHDREARLFYIRYLDMHAHLSGLQRVARPQPRRRRLPAAIIVGSAIAASIAAAWFAPSLMRSDGVKPAPPNEIQKSPVIAEAPRTNSYVATVVSAEPGTLVNGKAITEGMRVATEPMLLSAGTITVQMDGGAQITFRAESRFAFVSRRDVTVSQGAFFFRGDETCEPVKITTPHSIFRDIGTQYGAKVDALSEELHVIDGLVQRTVGMPGNHRPELVNAGLARRYSAGKPGEVIALDTALRQQALSAFDTRKSSRNEQSWAHDAFASTQKTLDGLSTGAGWSGPWVSKKRPPALRLISPGLTGNGSVAVIHNATDRSAKARRAAAHRRLLKPIDLSRDGIAYLRFLIRQGPTTGDDIHLGMVVLRTHGLDIDEEINRQSFIRFAFQRNDGVLVRLKDRVSRATLPFSRNHTAAVVAKIVSGSSNPDQVFMRVFDPRLLSSTPEPNDWSITSESLDTDMILDQVSLEFASNGKIMLGDLCIGPTWQSVTQPLKQPSDLADD